MKCKLPRVAAMASTNNDSRVVVVSYLFPYIATNVIEMGIRKTISAPVRPPI